MGLFLSPLPQEQLRKITWEAYMPNNTPGEFPTLTFPSFFQSPEEICPKLLSVF